MSENSANRGESRLIAASTAQAKNSFFGLLLSHLRKNKVKVLLLLFAIALSKLTLLAVPFAFASLVDSAASVQQLPTALSLAILSLIILYGVLSVLGIFFQELKEYFSTKLISKIIADIGTSIFLSIHTGPRSNLLDSRFGALARDIDRGLKGLQSIAGILMYSLIPTLIEVTFVTIYFAANYTISFVLVLVITMALYVMYSFYATNRWATSREKINQTDSDANQKLIASLMNYDLIKFFGREEYELKRYQNDLKENAELITKAQSSHSKIIVGQQIIVTIGLATVFFLALQNIYDRQMTVGDLVLINGLMISVCAPLAFLGMIYKDTLQSVIDVKKLNAQVDVFTNPVGKSKSESRLAHINDGFELRFENVSFRYPDERRESASIENINLTLKPGTTTAIVGESGSGKSTIARLIFGLYEPTSGKITLNGMDIKSLPDVDVRKTISIAPQDPILFHGSARENIGYGNLEADDRAIREAAKISQISGFLESLPHGYDTTIGERGQKLSGGEQQRIGIARALIKSAPIVILDEPSASLDAGTEQIMLSQLKNHLKGKTVLLITHKLQTISNADLICLMHKGRIVETGTHEALISKGGFYKTLWSKQHPTA
jgi:ABC-type transport system involved in Fe-S cluster assembly fused permease/ATPase subunit